MGADSQKGALRVRSVEGALWRFGYRTAILSRSGQRRGPRANSNALDGDILGIAPHAGLPHLIVEVGGRSKSILLSLMEMTAQPLPDGLFPIVVRQVASRPKKKWRWSVATNKGFDSLEELLAAL